MYLGKVRTPIGTGPVTIGNKPLYRIHLKMEKNADVFRDADISPKNIPQQTFHTSNFGRKLNQLNKMNCVFLQLLY